VPGSFARERVLVALVQSTDLSGVVPFIVDFHRGKVLDPARKLLDGVSNGFRCFREALIFQTAPSTCGEQLGRSGIVEVLHCLSISPKRRGGNDFGGVLRSGIDPTCKGLREGYVAKQSSAEASEISEAQVVHESGKRG
jgi:hypothetical protein